MAEDRQEGVSLEKASARRRVDLVALVPGLVFVVLAVVLMTGVDLPWNLFRGGGILWIGLIGAGIALLVSELRKSHRTD